MKETIAHQLGQQVRSFRTKYNFTQEDLAIRCHISLKYIQKMEGKTPPNVGIVTLEKLANGFGVPLWKLLKFD